MAFNRYKLICIKSVRQSRLEPGLRMQSFNIGADTLRSFSACLTTLTIPFCRFVLLASPLDLRLAFISPIIRNDLLQTFPCSGRPERFRAKRDFAICLDKWNAISAKWCSFQFCRGKCLRRCGWTSHCSIWTLNVVTAAFQTNQYATDVINAAIADGYRVLRYISSKIPSRDLQNQ